MAEFFSTRGRIPQHLLHHGESGLRIGHACWRSVTKDVEFNKPAVGPPFALRGPGRALGTTERGARKENGKERRTGPDFDLGRAARVTPGFSGADLANVVNEARCSPRAAAPRS